MWICIGIEGELHDRDELAPGGAGNKEINILHFVITTGEFWK